MIKPFRSSQFFPDGTHRPITYRELMDLIICMTDEQKSASVSIELEGEFLGCKEIDVVGPDDDGGDADGILDPGTPFLRVWNGKEF